MNPGSASLKVLVSVGLTVIVGYTYLAVAEQRREAAAYRAYRAMIGCHQVDAMQTVGRLPPGMARPQPWVVARCTGRTQNYSSSDDYYDDDQREFQRALKEAGW